MAIVHLGAKRLQGTKLDRVNDSLGSSADGTNSGITLLTGAETLKGTPDLTENFGDSSSHSSDGTTVNGWYSSDSDKTFYDGTNNYGRFDFHGGTNSALSFDLQQSGNGGLGTSINSTKWTLRFKFHIITNGSGHTNGSQGYLGIADHDGSATDPPNQDFIGLSLMQNHSLGDRVINGSCNGANPVNFGNTGGRYGTLSLADNTSYYVQITRNGDNCIVEIFSDSGYSSSLFSNTQTISGITGLRYIIFEAQKDSGALTTAYVDDVKFYDNSITKASDSKLGSGSYSFDGSNDYVQIGSSATDFKFFSDNSSEYSLCFWLKPDQTSSHVMLFNNNASTNTNVGIQIMQLGANIRMRVGGDSSGDVWTMTESSAVTTGEWSHWALTWDKTTARMYKNGVEVETATKISGRSFSTSNPEDTGLRIGADSGSGSSNYDGVMDDIGIFKRALTATEIGKLANNNLAAWGASEGQSAVSGNTGSGSITFADNKCKILSATYTDVYAYGLDMGVDITGDYCLDFEFTMNSNTYVSTGQACGWILGLSVANSAPSGENPSHANYEQIKFNSYTSGNPYVYTRSKNASGTNDNYSQEPVFTLNTSTAETRYGRIVRDGTTYKLSVYDNSGRTSQVGSDVSTTTNASQNVRYLYIKQFTQNSSNTWDFSLDNIKLYNGQTSATGSVTKTVDFTQGDAQLVSSLSNKAGLKAHYSMDAISGAPSGIAPDDGGNANSYSNVSVDTTNKKAGTGSYDFADGGVVGNANQSYGISGTASWTISCWIRPHAVGSNEALFRKQHTNGTSDFEFGVNSSNIFCWIEGNSTNMVSSPANNTWYHLVVRRVSGDKDYFYVNGSEVSSTSTQNSIDDNSGFRWYLGRRKESGNETFNGNMDEWGIWNRALTTSEITALYNSGDGAKIDSIDTTDLVIYWNFEQVPLAQQALPKCSNDASATSDLEAMTNIPTNTIFEQTDDTPAYFWKQSDNTWKLDGGSEINVPMTSSSWTFQGNQGSAHTHSIDNGVKWVSQYANNKLGAGVAVGTIGATLGSKWVARYNWTGTGSYTEGGNGYVIIGLSDDGTYGSSDTTNTQGGDSAQVQWHIGNNSGDRHYRVRGWNGGSNTDGSTTGGNTVPWVAETQYFELSYDGTTLKHQRYTDSTYSTAHSVVTPTKDISGITGLTHIIFGSNDTGHSHGGFTLTLNEFKIQKGFSEWQ